MNKFLIILTLSVALLGAKPIKVDSPLYKLNSFKYETPQGRNMRVPKKTKLVIVAFGKDTGALVNEFLDSKGAY